MGTYGDLLELDKKPSEAVASAITIPQQALIPSRPFKQKIRGAQAAKTEPAVHPRPVRSDAAQRKKIKRRDTTTPRYHATMPPRYHDTLIPLIRTAVKQFGKEAATHRFTIEEKKAIADLVYSYKKVGTRTSENEISRIGVNFLIEDYQANGQNSILEQVLRALNG